MTQKALVQAVGVSRQVNNAAGTENTGSILDLNGIQGTNKSKFLITGGADIKVACVVLS